MNQKSPSRFHYGHVIVFCCCLIMFVHVGLVMSCAGIFYTPVSQSLGVEVGKFGLYMSFNFLASTLMLSVAGRMMERFGARLMLSVNSAILGGCLVAMGFFNAVWQFYIAGALIGITLAFLLYLSFPTLVAKWFRSRVGLYMGICSAASGVGGVVFNPICAQMIEHYGWRATYQMSGGFILLIITPILALLLRDNPPEEDVSAAQQATRTATPQQGIEYRRALRMPVFYLLIVFAFLMNATAPLNLFMPSYVTGLSTAQQGAWVASAVMLGVTIGKVLLGIINDKSYTLGVLTTTLCGIVGLIVLVGGPIWALLPGGFLFGWAYAGVSVQTPLLVRAVFGNRSYAAIYSNIAIALAAGGAIAAGGWGLLADHTSYPFVFLSGCVSLLICLGIGLYALHKQTKINA